MTEDNRREFWCIAVNGVAWWKYGMKQAALDDASRLVEGTLKDHDPGCFDFAPKHDTAKGPQELGSLLDVLGWKNGTWEKSLQAVRALRQCVDSLKE